MKIVVASNNEGKIKEIKNIFNNYDILSIKDIEELFNVKIDILENGKSFMENSLIKAEYIYNIVGSDYIVIADDSGLEIDALNGFPSINTNRFMEGSSNDKNLNILKRMEGIINRTCHYKCSVSLISSNIKLTVEKKLDGVISNEIKGDNGFGFDSIFVYNNKTLAEIDLNDKLEISPRKMCLDIIKEVL